MKRRGLKTAFLGALGRNLYRNLSGTYACKYCMEDTQIIMAEMRKRKEITIKLVPMFNCMGLFESYHVNFVGDREQPDPHKKESTW